MNVPLQEASHIFGRGKETAFEKACTDEYLELILEQEVSCIEPVIFIQKKFGPISLIQFVFHKPMAEVKTGLRSRCHCEDFVCDRDYL